MKVIRPLLPLLILGLVVSTSRAEKTDFDLSDLICLGLEKSPRIQAAREDIQAKNAAYLASKRFSNPRFGYDRGRAESYDASVIRDTEGFSLHQPVENPFSRRSRLDIQKKRRDISMHRYQYLQREVVFEIKGLFYRILLLKNHLATAQKNETSVQETYRLIQKRAEAGEVKELEAIKLRVETLRAQNKTNRLQAELSLAKENLNAFLGNTLPPGYRLNGDLGYQNIPLDKKKLLMRTRSTHPLLMMMKTELEQTKSRLHLARWKWLPGFELSAFSRKELDGTNRGLGISVDIPLWDQKSKQVAEAEHMVVKAQSELRAFEIELATLLKEEITQFLLAEKTLTLFQEGLLQQADESMRISRLSYSQGEISLLDYLDSLRTLYSIQTDFQDALFKWNITKAALEQYIGEDLK